MSLVVYVEASGGENPGHMVVGTEPDPGGSVPPKSRYYGYRFDPTELPKEYRPPAKWRDCLFANTVPGHIMDETAYIHRMWVLGQAYYTKRSRGDYDLSTIVPPQHQWRSFALYSFNPDDFHNPAQPCYNCVTWGIGIANQVVAEFLNPVRQGRVKEIIKQLMLAVSPGESTDG